MTVRWPLEAAPVRPRRTAQQIGRRTVRRAGKGIEVSKSVSRVRRAGHSRSEGTNRTSQPNMRVTLLHHTYIQNTSWFIHPTLATQKCCQIQHAVLRTHPHMRTERRPERRPGSHALGGRRRDAHDGAMPDATWHAFERWEPLVRCGRGSVMAPLISLLECPHQVVVDADGPCTERNGRPLRNVTAGRHSSRITISHAEIG